MLSTPAVWRGAAAGPCGYLRRVLRRHVSAPSAADLGASSITAASETATTVAAEQCVLLTSRTSAPRFVVLCQQTIRVVL